MGVGRTTTIAVALLAGCIADVHVADDVGLGGGQGTVDGPPTDDDGGTAAPDTEGTATAEATGTDTGGEAADGPKYDLSPPDTGGPLPVGCIGGNDKIWVVVLNADEKLRAELYRFDPERPEFEWVANLECMPLLEHTDQLISLGVARDGVAHFPMMSTDARGTLELGTLELLADDPCATLQTRPWNPPAGYNNLAYVALDPEVPEDETLFAHSYWPQVFGEVRLDLPQVVVDFIGASPQPYMTLAGTADGRLFAVAGVEIGLEGNLVTLDPATGSQLDVLIPVDTMALPAFFGGDVLLFEANQLGLGLWAPRVLRYDVDDDDGNGEHELTEIFGEADDPPNLFVRSVASPTCIPVTPEG